MQLSSKRHLTPSERTELIQACLDTYTAVRNLPASMRDRFEAEFAQLLDRDLARVQLYPESFPEFRRRLVTTYRPVAAAKSVGIICGQSIGEMQTQTTLNTFHKTGLTEKLVVAGVPRFLEIIDTNRSETQGTPSAYVFFREPIPQHISEARQIVGASLVYHTFGRLLQTWSFTREADGTLSIVYTFNLELLFRYKIRLVEIAERVRAQFPAYQLQPSPLHEGKIQIWPMRTADDFSALEDEIHPQLAQIPICGIERIQNVFFMKQGNEWSLETDGSNLENILNLPYVDTYRTYSNDIWEIYALFGIEAVRTYIVEELVQLMPTIHPTHITLLADRMTVSGRLRSISRYTRKHENSSVLSKATFEETLSGFLRSAVMHEVDTVNGSSASIICGRLPKVGTGMNDLLV